jgi:hypothetical protein
VKVLQTEAVQSGHSQHVHLPRSQLLLKRAQVVERHDGGAAGCETKVAVGLELLKQSRRLGTTGACLRGRGDDGRGREGWRRGGVVRRKLQPVAKAQREDNGHARWHLFKLLSDVV